MPIRRLLLLSLLAFTVLGLSACAPSMRFAPGDIPRAEVPPQDLKVQAEHYVAAYLNEAQYKEMRGGKAYARVKNVVERLSRAAGYPANTFPVHLVDAGEEVNAAAFNGASIVVFRALLEAVHSDDELATILGHEIGHIIAKHYQDEKEAQARASTVSTTSSILGSIASVATSAAGFGGVSDLAADATEGATGLIGYGAFVGSFNRTQEYEADHIGIIIMAKAGYDPNAALRFWDRSEEIFGSSGSKVGAFFSTHPAASDRRKHLEEALPIAVAAKKTK